MYIFKYNQDYSQHFPEHYDCLVGHPSVLSAAPTHRKTVRADPLVYHAMLISTFPTSSFD